MLYSRQFNSNWQPSTKSRDVKDGQTDSLSREPEMIRAFRDTWKDGIHSYLSYFRDRLFIARELLHSRGSIFVQIGDENVHLVRCLLDEVFGNDCLVTEIAFLKTTSATSRYVGSVIDYILWYAKDFERLKYHTLFKAKAAGADGAEHYSGLVFPDGVRRAATMLERSGIEALADGATLFTADQLQSAGMGREKGEGAASWFPVTFEGRTYRPTAQTRWKTNETGMARLIQAGRVIGQKTTLRYLRKISDFPAYELHNYWTDVGGATDKRYVVETAPRVLERCLLMTTDPGDLVLDPTCGSGTTAYIAEQWGRRWITIDTSRVALALARQRLMAARYPFYLLKDSAEGARKEGQFTIKPPRNGPFGSSIRQGFVCERVSRVQLGSIARNGDRNHLGKMGRDTRSTARSVERRAGTGLGGMGDAARGRTELARRSA